MPRPAKGPRLGGGPAHERLLLANLATALITHRSIKTTETKAKRLQPLADRLVTFAKRGDLHARRRVMTVVRDKTAVHELFTEIAPLVADRPGGYTRITKLGFRKGDNAPLAQIELVLEPLQPKTAAPARKSRAAAPAAAAAPVAEAPVAEETVAEAPAEDEAVVTSNEAAVDEAAGGADDVPVEETDTVEQSEPTPAESETPAAAEVEADAAEVADDTKK